ncbi:DedA family protein [Paenibacillus sp. TRM 82003]|uniref:DedA family protein n=1 Tax=Kineococcus sp. TRM81007 TaxID=2925831 RepID=UPI001F57F84C|nr:DedA family protein [Kineococcus sp. TRM81007]MCI2240484.1 DedA family protein [Kineococcus sp. TRM81007]MCI3925217.1 DedA family protein [Paenibacillus sp. TRM 82003]
MSDWFAQLADPQLEHLGALGVYALVFGIVFAETGTLVGFWLPGSTVLFTAGLLAARDGSPLSLTVLVVGVTLAAILGDTVGYWSGRRLGRPWLLRRAGKAAKHLPRAEDFYARYGWFAVVGCRYIPWLRAFTPIIAGTAVMPYAAFASANVVGALTWGALLVLAGYAADSLPWIRTLAYVIAGTAIVFSIVAPIAGAVRRRRAARSR